MGRFVQPARDFTRPAAGHGIPKEFGGKSLRASKGTSALIRRHFQQEIAERQPIRTKNRRGKAGRYRRQPATIITPCSR